MKKAIAMIIVKILMNALPEKRKEVFQTLLSMIESIRQEEGCRSYHVFQDIENHMRSSVYGVLLGTKFLLKEPHDIQTHTVLNTEGKEIVNANKGKRI